MNKEKISKIIGCDKRYILQFLIWTFFIMIIGFYIDETLKILYTKPDIDIIMPPSYDEKEIFKINLISGDKPLENIKVKVKSCYMDDWNYYYPDDLPAGATTTVNFVDSETLNKSKLIDCQNDPFGNKEVQMAHLKIYKNITSGKLIVPTQEYIMWGCARCYWNISITSDKINKTFYKELFSPVSLVGTFYGTGENIVNSSDVIFYSEVGFGVFDERTWEMIGGYEK